MRFIFPEFIDNGHMEVARLSALCNGSLYTRRYRWYSFPVREKVDLRAIVSPEGLNQ
jgi:hypothetical protein